jgi:hypothetical protein
MDAAATISSLCLPRTPAGFDLNKVSALVFEKLEETGLGDST